METQGTGNELTQNGHRAPTLYELAAEDRIIALRADLDALKLKYEQVIALRRADNMRSAAVTEVVIRFHDAYTSTNGNVSSDVLVEIIDALGDALDGSRGMR